MALVKGEGAELLPLAAGGLAAPGEFWPERVGEVASDPPQRFSWFFRGCKNPAWMSAAFPKALGPWLSCARGKKICETAGEAPRERGANVFPPVRGSGRQSIVTKELGVFWL